MMQIQRYNGTLSVAGVRELSAANARWFRNEVCAALSPGLKTIEIELSQADLVDSCGLGALVSLLKAANDGKQNGDIIIMRLLNPQPPVQQVFELTRMHLMFEIVPENSRARNSRATQDHLHHEPTPEQQ